MLIKDFADQFCSLEKILDMTERRKPNFNNLLAVLDKKRPERPTLFEFFMSEHLYSLLTSDENAYEDDDFQRACRLIRAFRRAGYDYVTLYSLQGFTFRKPIKMQGKTVSLNQNAVIRCRQDLKDYVWPCVEDIDFGYLDRIQEVLPEGMKAIICSTAGGILEEAISLMGYERFCINLHEDPRHVEELFNVMGGILVDFYRKCASYNAIGACIVNDDWGFNTQTFISPQQLRKYVVPWHKRMVEAIHEAGKPAIIHSCGNLKNVIDYIIDEIGFDGKHSYEDKIMPVEEAYDVLKGRIAVLGGIDVNFVCHASPRQIYERSVRMLALAENCGGYALGTGNSVPDYVPPSNYFAMIAAALAGTAP